VNGEPDFTQQIQIELNGPESGYNKTIRIWKALYKMNDERNDVVNERENGLDDESDDVVMNGIVNDVMNGIVNDVMNGIGNNDELEEEVMNGIANDVDEPEKCSICLALLSSRLTTQTQCGHTFHQHCYIHWAETLRSLEYPQPVTCPYCRTVDNKCIGIRQNGIHKGVKCNNNTHGDYKADIIPTKSTKGTSMNNNIVGNNFRTDTCSGILNASGDYGYGRQN